MIPGSNQCEWSPKKNLQFLTTGNWRLLAHFRQQMPNIRNFSKWSKSSHVAYHSTRILMLILKMYKFVGLSWVILELSAKNHRESAFSGCGPKIGSYRLIIRELLTINLQTCTFLKSALKFASNGMQHNYFLSTLKNFLH